MTSHPESILPVLSQEKADALINDAREFRAYLVQLKADILSKNPTAFDHINKK